MAAIDLLLEHRTHGRSRRMLRVAGGAELFLIGSSSSADLRLTGEGVGGCHAALKYSDGGWTLCDLSGSEGTRVDGAAIVERELKLDEPLNLEIGSHSFTVIARPRLTNLFEREIAGESVGALTVHQVIVRNRRGHVVETRLLKAHEPFVYSSGEVEGIGTPDQVTLAAPTSGSWISSTVGAYSVRQRLISAQEAALPEGFAFDRNLKYPLLLVLAIFLLFAATGTLLNSRTQTPEVALDKKSMDIIYNAQAVKLKRAESKTIAKARAQQKASTAQTEAQSKPAGGAAGEEATAPKSTAKASQALASLRASGLSSLVGKIAKRAAKQSLMVATAGVSPDTAGAGRAFFSQGTSTVGGGGQAKAGPTYKLGSISTTGKGGGTGAEAKAGTGLSSGKVGMGDVALVDEETVIEGGLDRDVIADVIKRNLGQIRYCYERQLSSNPDLYGKVMVKFTIGAAGEVGEPKIDTTTMKSALVEGCILRRVASWKFPQPRGGTQVKVSYPFLFKALD